MKTPVYCIRLPTDLRERLEAAAKAENRTLANYIINVLTASVQPSTRKERKK